MLSKQRLFVVVHKVCIMHARPVDAGVGFSQQPMCVQHPHHTVSQRHTTAASAVQDVRDWLPHSI